MATKISKHSTRKSTGKKAATEASRVRSAGRRIKPKTANVKAKTVASKLPLVSAAKTAAAKKKFEHGILARGEAVQAGNPLPAGATHEIVGKARDGSPILKRKRFSMT
jgi:hypothetical protein